MPEIGGRLTRAHLVGIFALHCDPELDPVGTVGAVAGFRSGVSTLNRIEFVSGRHYWDSKDVTPICRVNGDGTSIDTMGHVEHGEHARRVDVISIDVPFGLQADAIFFEDSGTPASFLIFDVFFEVESASVCPFRNAQGQVSLSELASIVRVGDKAKFARALSQLSEGVLATGEDLDEARGQALAFVAVVLAALLELGGPRTLHSFILDAARKLEVVSTAQEVAETAITLINEVSEPYIADESGACGALIARALNIVDRNYARELTDKAIAEQLGLSTSHFRHLFKQITGQPFHKYVVALRLEKAREMLSLGDQPVINVAREVGFTSPAHFSRAFNKRFRLSPSSLRQARR